MEKTAIVSCYFKHNYGSVLQAYATQYYLDSIGIENETINVKENKDFANGKRKYYAKQLTNLSFIKSKLKMIDLVVNKKINKELNANIQKRTKKYNEFAQNIRLTSPFTSYKELEKQCENYKNIIVGSDQLWLPVNVVADYYTLNWVPNEINKISLGTSFGVSEIPKKYSQEYSKFLNRIDSISVREASGVKLVEEFTKKQPFLSCDPTMLLSKNDWESIQTKERIIKEKYIFCYLLGSNIEHRKFAEKLREKTGYKIVSINHADEYVPYSDKYADEAPYDIGPAEWLNLINNAEYVCTDSFHGLIFSLIFNKQFFIFERYKSQNKKISTNSRIYSVLDSFNLKDRLLKGNENLKEVMESKIVFEDINEKLNISKNETENFIKKSLK